LVTRFSYPCSGAHISYGSRLNGMLYIFLHFLHIGSPGIICILSAGWAEIIDNRYVACNIGRPAGPYNYLAKVTIINVIPRANIPVKGWRPPGTKPGAYINARH